MPLTTFLPRLVRRLVFGVFLVVLNGVMPMRADNTGVAVGSLTFDTGTMNYTSLAGTWVGVNECGNGSAAWTSTQ